MKNISRVLSLFLLMITVLSLFTGCVRSGVGIVINKDDSGDVELSYGFEESVYESLTEEYGADIFAGKDSSRIKDNDETYICVTEHRSFENLDELNTILTGLEYPSEQMNLLVEDEDGSVPFEAVEESRNRIFKSVIIEKKDYFFSTEYIVELVTNDGIMGNEETGLISIGEDGFYKLLVAITLPGEVTADGAVTQGNNASWKITNLREENVLHAESSYVNTTRTVTTVVIIVCIIILLGFLLWVSKKKTNNNKH